MGLVVSAVAALAFLAVAGRYLLLGERWMAAGWATNAFAVFLLFYNTNYLQYTYRTGHDFVRLSLVSVVQDALALVLVVLVAVWSFYGLCLRVVISGLVATALLYYWRPVRVGPKWNNRCLKHLLIIGAQIFLVAQFYTAWAYLDRTFVLAYTGDASMGSVCHGAHGRSDMRNPALGDSGSDLSAHDRTIRSHRKARRRSPHRCQADAPDRALAWFRWSSPAGGSCVRSWPSCCRIRRGRAGHAMVAVAVAADEFLPHQLRVHRGAASRPLLGGDGAGRRRLYATMFWLVRDRIRLAAFPQAMIVGTIVFLLACCHFCSFT